MAACVHRRSETHSTRRWQGAITTDCEGLLLINTRASGSESLSRRVLELHPYDVPELIAVPVSHGDAAYLPWVSCGMRDHSAAAM
ncbi:MAG: divalent-cation tolerance protein CutA [Rhodanobacter sp.]